MPVAARTLVTSGDGAARRSHPPSSPARRPLPTRTAAPLASAYPTADRSMMGPAGGGAEQAEELLAQAGSGRDVQFPPERGDDAAATSGPGSKTEVAVMSRGVEHSTSDQVSRDRPRVRIKPRRAAGRLTPAQRLRAAGESAHHHAQSSARVPLSALVRDLRRHGRSGAVGGRPGSGRARMRIRIRIRCGWFGHDVFPWLGGEMGGTSPGQHWPFRGLHVAGIHRVTAAARPGQSWPGSFHQTPASSAGTRHCEPRGHQRSR